LIETTLAMVDSKLDHLTVLVWYYNGLFAGYKSLRPALADC